VTLCFEAKCLLAHLICILEWNMNRSRQPSFNSEKNMKFVRNFVEDAFNRHYMAAVYKYYTLNLIKHNPQVHKRRAQAIF
jgi:hypothetical protein